MGVSQSANRCASSRACSPAHRSSQAVSPAEPRGNLNVVLSNDERILVLAPTSADAALSLSILTEARLACQLCPDLDALLLEWEGGAGAFLLTEEVLEAGDVRRLLDVIRS